MSETTLELTKKTIYAHGTLGMPLAVIGYPLAIWIPAHYSGGLGISLAMVGTLPDAGLIPRAVRVKTRRSDSHFARSCTTKLPVPHSGASRMLYSGYNSKGPLGTGANDGSPVTETLWPGVTVSSVLMPAS